MMTTRDPTAKRTSTKFAKKKLEKWDAVMYDAIKVIAKPRIMNTMLERTRMETESDLHKHLHMMMMSRHGGSKVDEKRRK